MGTPVLNDIQLLQERKLAIMPQMHYDMLADRVLSRNIFFRDSAFEPTVWDDVVDHAYRIMQHSDPELYMSCVKNELRQRYKSASTIIIGNQPFCRPDYKLIAFKLYVLLRYRFGQDKHYLDCVLPSLYEIIDNVNKTVLFGRGDTLHTLFQKIRPYKQPTLQDVARQVQQEYDASQAQAAAPPAEPDDKPAAQTETVPAIRVKDKHKTDLIKVLYAIASMGWMERTGGEKATIKDIMAFFGRNLDEEGITNYSPSFGKAKNGTLQTFLKPFTQMENLMRRCYNEHNS